MQECERVLEAASARKAELERGSAALRAEKGALAERVRELETRL